MTRLVIKDMGGSPTHVPDEDRSADSTKVVVVKNDNVRVITAGYQGMPGPHLITGAHDVDETNRRDGSILQFNEETGKYEATIEVRGLVINCGAF